MSLLNDGLLTQNANANVSVISNVNRYGYSAAGLIAPYALEILLTLIIVMMGIVSYYRHGVLPDKKFSDILREAADHEIFHTCEEVETHDAEQSHS